MQITSPFNMIKVSIHFLLYLSSFYSSSLSLVLLLIFILLSLPIPLRIIIVPCLRISSREGNVWIFMSLSDLQVVAVQTRDQKARERFGRS